MKPQYTMPVSEYLRRTYNTRFGTYVRKNGKGYYLVNGELIPEAKYKKDNAVPEVSLILGKENPCKKHSYVY